MYSPQFIESHTVYVRDGSMYCADCGDEALATARRECDNIRRELRVALDTDDRDTARALLESLFTKRDERTEWTEARTLDDGESDSPRSCDSCHCFIPGALTTDGSLYVAEALRDYLRDDTGARDVLAEWFGHYFSGPLPMPLGNGPRRAILRTFSRLDRDRRAIEKFPTYFERAERAEARAHRVASSAAAALRDAWIARTYGCDDVRRTLREAARAHRRAHG